MAEDPLKKLFSLVKNNPEDFEKQLKKDPDMLESTALLVGIFAEAQRNSEKHKKTLNDANQILDLLENGSSRDFSSMKPVDGLTLLTVCSLIDEQSRANAIKLLNHEKAKKAADDRHDKPDGSREKANNIRNIWATGKYTSRDICAEQECAALNMSFSTARKALRNTPDHTKK